MASRAQKFEEALQLAINEFFAACDEFQLAEYPFEKQQAAQRVAAAKKKMKQYQDLARQFSCAEDADEVKYLGV